MDKQDILDLIDNGHDMEEYETTWEFFEAMNSNGDIDSLVDSSIDIYNYDLANGRLKTMIVLKRLINRKV